MVLKKDWVSEEIIRIRQGRKQQKHVIKRDEVKITIRKRNQIQKKRKKENKKHTKKTKQSENNDNKTKPNPPKNERKRTKNTQEKETKKQTTLIKRKAAAQQADDVFSREA